MSSSNLIETDRLVLRPPQPSDAEAITAGIGVRDVAWNLGRAPFPYALKDAEAWIKAQTKARDKDQEYTFLITTTSQGVIGAVGISDFFEGVWEIGYWLAKPHWDKGYVTEAASALLDWARSTKGLDRFSSGHFIDNPASGRVLEKLGFEHIGEMDMEGKARGGKHPAARYVLNAPAEAALRRHAH